MQNKPMLIGVAGPAGSGKDTVGDWFVKNLGFQKLAIAGSLKAGLAAMGLPEPADRADKEKPIPGLKFSWRDAAQMLGTEWGRKLDPNLWLNLAQRKIQFVLEDHIPVVVTDIRFENEATMIRELGGQVLHVTGRKADLGANTGHASEVGIAFNAQDIVILNMGDLEELYVQLREITNV